MLWVKPVWEELVWSLPVVSVSVQAIDVDHDDSMSLVVYIPKFHILFEPMPSSCYTNRADSECLMDHLS